MKNWLEKKEFKNVNENWKMLKNLLLYIFKKNHRSTAEREE